jgi:hypothetical protein
MIAKVVAQVDKPAAQDQTKLSVSRKTRGASLLLNNKQEKQFIIDRASTVTEDIFKKICIEKKKSQVSAARLTKSKLLAYLSRRYKGPVAKIIAQCFDFSTNFDYETFIEEVE